MSAPAPTTTRPTRSGPLPGSPSEVLTDVLIVAVGFAVLGVVGAFVWHAVVHLPTYTRSGTGGLMDQVQLAEVMGIDGWFFTIGGVGGLLAGAVLMLARRTRPVLMVVLLAAGGALAAWLMVVVGLHLGPADPDVVLRTAAKGTRVPLQLHTKAHVVEYAWSLGAVLSGLVVLLLSSPRPAATESRVVPDKPTDEGPPPPDPGR
ncbi:hypothetical protein [Nocardioides terrisoli]|uniref:hypothetical protein n=1 Tax=Nocardioides terrisoli TaxID=3388267 RepID=UPI00287BA662|nr:hypothetical protein [Nocardioides marmorisolisilvae]